MGDERQAEGRSKQAVAIRLELPPVDHARLAHCARARGLSLAGYSRQAVLAMIRADERSAADTTANR